MGRKVGMILFFVIFLLISLFNLTNVFAFSGEGLGTLVNPFQITNWTQLNETRNNLTANYILMNNLTTNGDYVGFGDSWLPIGNCGGDTCFGKGNPDNPFSGNFDGNNNTISNLIIYQPTEDSIAGFFGLMGGNISNIGLINVNVTGYGNVGGLIGYQCGGTITNSYVVGNVTGVYSFVGGLLGHQTAGTVSNSYFAGKVNGSYFQTGGLAGEAIGVISNCHSTAEVTGSDLVGGLVGFSLGELSSSYATGAVSGYDWVGGLVGSQDGGLINNSYSTGNVTGHFFVGGLLGHQTAGTVSNSYSFISGMVNGTDIVGALVGDSVGSITFSYSLFEMHATLFGTSNVGFIGNNRGAVSNSDMNLENAFGKITFLEMITSGTGNILESIVIGNNSAYVNSSQSYLNRSAKITLNLTGLGITNPQILKDGVVCSAPDCNLLSYENENVIFNVTSWSNYSIGGSLSEVVAETPRSSGDGRGGSINLDYYNLSNLVAIQNGSTSFMLGGARHYFKVLNMSTNYAWIELRSDPQQVFLKLGESKSVYFEGVGVNVTLKRIVGKIAYFSLAKLQVVSTAGGNKSVNFNINKIENKGKQVSTNNLLFFYVAILVLILALAVYLILANRNLKRYNKRK